MKVRAIASAARRHTAGYTQSSAPGQQDPKGAVSPCYPVTRTSFTTLQARLKRKSRAGV